MRRQNSPHQFSQYILPAIIALVIIGIGIKIFSSDDLETTASRGSESVDVSFSSGSKVSIRLSGGSSHEITGSEKLYPSDQGVVVAGGEATIATANNSKIYLDVRGELSYSGNLGGSEAFVLKSGTLWAEAAGPLVITTNHANFEINAGSVVSVYKTQIASRVYVLKGSADVSIGSNRTPVSVGQQLEITAADANNPSTLIGKIIPIGSELKTTDLYVRHNGESYFAAPATEIASGSTLSGSISVGVNTNELLVITSPSDESSIEGSLVDIEGRVSPEVIKVLVGTREASINRENSSFEVKQYKLTSKTNDIVVKALDSEERIVSKQVLVVYSNQPTVTTATAITYTISPKDFTIIAPATPAGTNTYRTNTRSVRIEGRVTKGQVKYITVNDFRLTKFPALGTYWQYNANMDYGNMATGYNEYKIRYYDQNDTQIFEQPFVIIREEASALSGEAISSN